MANISEIKGLDDASAAKLGEQGIKTIDAFLKACGEKKGRKDLASNTGLDEKLF